MSKYSDPITATGSLISFSTDYGGKIDSLTIPLSPIQSLNGYDSPWPAGGGKNKTATQTVSLTTNTATDIAVDDAGTESKSWILSFDLTNADVTTASAALFNFLDNGANHYFVPTSLKRVSDNVYWANVQKPATGRFYATYTGILSSIKCFYESASYGKWSGGDISNIMLEVGTAPSASFAPYSNICPISGRTGVEVYRTGKNMLPALKDGTYEGNGVDRKSVV